MTQTPLENRRVQEGENEWRESEGKAAYIILSPTYFSNKGQISVSNYYSSVWCTTGLGFQFKSNSYGVE